jgi:hypothetical protein
MKTTSPSKIKKESEKRIEVAFYNFKLQNNKLF